MKRRSMILGATLSVAMATIAGLPGAAVAASVKGEVVTLVVPNSAGGRMAQYARMIAPYIAKHAGAEDVRIEIMRGGGGVKGTNYLWFSKPDGKTIAFTSVPTLILAQLSGSEAVQFDATKFVYLGRAATEGRVLTVGGKSPIKTIDDVRHLGRPFVFPSQGTDEDFYSMAVLADALNVKLKVVTGYEGNADTALAVIKGEGDNWIVNARLKYRDQEIVAPIPVKMKFSGDTAVLTVDNLMVPGGGSYTARLLIYERTYSGTWKGQRGGGMLYGTISNETE